MKGNIIFGLQETGKSRMATLMFRNHQPWRIDGHSLRDRTKKDAEHWLRYLLQSVRSHVKCVLIDDFPGKHFELLLPYLIDDYLKINPQNHPVDYIHPEITIVCHDLGFNQLPRHIRLFMNFNFYSCVINADHDITMVMHHPEMIDKKYANLDQD